MKIEAILFAVAALAVAATSAIAEPKAGSTQPSCCQPKSSCCPASACCTATKYTCEMHPEVTADKPGKCPKCGMNLEPVKAKK